MKHHLGAHDFGIIPLELRLWFRERGASQARSTLSGKTLPPQTSWRSTMILRVYFTNTLISTPKYVSVLRVALHLGHHLGTSSLAALFGNRAFLSLPPHYDTQLQLLLQSRSRKCTRYVSAFPSERNGFVH